MKLHLLLLKNRFSSIINNVEENFSSISLRFYLLYGIIFVLVFFFASDSVSHLYKLEQRIEENYITGNYIETIELLDRYLNVYPEDLLMNYIKASSLFNIVFSSDYLDKISNETKNMYIDEAILSYEKMLNRKNNDKYLTSDDFARLSFLYFYKGREFFENAFQYVKISEKLNKIDKRRDEIFAESKINDFKIVVEGRPFSFNFSAVAGYVAFKLKKYRMSLNYFKKASLNAKGKIYHFYIGHLYKRLKEYDKAIEQFMYVISFETNREVIYNCFLMLVELYEKVGNTEAATTYLEKYLKNNPKTAYLCYKLGEFYEKQKKIDNAIECWVESLKIDDNYHAAKIKLFQFRGNYFTDLDKKKKSRKKKKK